MTICLLLWYFFSPKNDLIKIRSGSNDESELSKFVFPIKTSFTAFVCLFAIVFLFKNNLNSFGIGCEQDNELKNTVFQKYMWKNKKLYFIFRKFSQKLPSVSKIIQATMPPEQRAILDRWEAMKIEELGKLIFSIIDGAAVASRYLNCDLLIYHSILDIYLLLFIL